MKKGLLLAISLIALLVSLKFGTEAFESSSASKESIRANNTYQKLITALNGYFDSHGVLPKSFSDLEFEGTAPNIENFQYTRDDDHRCIVSFHGTHGGYFVHPLNYETTFNQQGGPR